MVMSVNTNAAAMIALQKLNATNRQLERTQLRVTAGLKVNRPKGDPAVNVAITAGKAVASLLMEMKAKIVQANQSGLYSASRTALHNDFLSLYHQITTIVETAEFNGKNLITSAAANFTVLSTVDGSVITVSAQTLDTSSFGIASRVINTGSGAAVGLTAINSVVILTSDKLAALGSSSKRIETQADFTGKLVDILKEGLGNLIDADLAEESANLQAYQIKQQLGVRSLSIANAGPSSILQLFQTG
jgi:flagellin